MFIKNFQIHHRLLKFNFKQIDIHFFFKFLFSNNMCFSLNVFTTSLFLEPQNKLSYIIETLKIKL
jgi:hypothetical protein